MYKIRKYRSYRPKTDYIILTQSVNLIRTDKFITPKVYRGNYKFTWGIWQEYFMHDCLLDDVPCHYFCELLDKDYVIYKGCADQKRSIFIEDLFKYGLIEPQYRNSILVVLQDNFQYEIPEKRMYDHLSAKLFSQLLRQYHMTYDRIKILDDILVPNWKELLEASPLKYTIYPHTHFDQLILDLSVQKFHKF